MEFAKKVQELVPRAEACKGDEACLEAVFRDAGELLPSGRSPATCMNGT